MPRRCGKDARYLEAKRLGSPRQDRHARINDESKIDTSAYRSDKVTIKNKKNDTTMQ
jgi:hypothetical protein